MTFFVPVYINLHEISFEKCCKCCNYDITNTHTNDVTMVAMQQKL